ncbi:SDR family NAD(P)-dependent oxidoreductase [Actinomadura sp. KC345]|uniref:SDR family oxidoreductase n=1 Tax=Actinomadura sp. KC345 TaxID=2530371 RepID=UPI0010470F4F|nr:SDR family NAD(P)-dependent oxidoreductase [Actinomadura sp. KC345]TDC55616.1 SDR family NAD(P)-dependent oxidoreductase [Actinomadura sp. KC345]
MERLDGTTALITGGAQGIGLAIARALAQQGGRLALADRDGDALRSAADELSPLTQVETFHLDVRDRAAFAQVADEVEDRLGPVDVLCNNAGIAFPETVDEMTYELWDLALDINLGGVVNGIQTFLPRMLERGAPGHIVNTASAAGLVAATGYMYTASKFAVVGLSESLRNQLETGGHPIGVTVLCPGGVATNIANSTRTLVTEQQGGGATFIKAQSRIEELAPKVENILRQAGVSPDSVGALVVDAIKADRLYILTDRAGTDLLTARTEAIIASMPSADPNASTFDDLKNAVHRSSSNP